MDPIVIIGYDRQEMTIAEYSKTHTLPNNHYLFYSGTAVVSLCPAPDQGAHMYRIILDGGRIQVTHNEARIVVYY